MSARKPLAELTAIFLLPSVKNALSLALFGCTACATVPAFAYVGPGAGLGVVGIVLAIGAALLMAVVGIVMWPIRALARRMKRSRSGENITDTGSTGKLDKATTRDDGQNASGSDANGH